MKINTSHIFLFYLYLYLFDGVVKGISFLIHFPMLGQLKSVVLVVLFFVGNKKAIKSLSIKKGSLLIFMSFLFYLIYSLCIGLNIFQVIFAIKLIFPLLLVSLIYRNCEAFLTKSNHYIFIIILAMIGLILNQFISFPWQGLSITIGDIDLASSRLESFGSSSLKRLPGFGSTPGTTSFLVLVCYIFIMLSYKDSLFRLKFNIISVLTLSTIILSTQKSTLLAFFMLYTPIFLYAFVCKKRFLFKWSSLVSFLFLLIPFLMSLNIYLKSKSFSGVIVNDMFNSGTTIFFASFADRIYNTWPFTLYEYMSKDYINIMFGTGLGSVGPPAKYFMESESVKVSPGDGIIVTLISYFGIFGFLSLIIIFAVFYNKVSKDFSNSPIGYLLLSAFFIIGSSFNVIDNPMLILGLLTSFSYLSLLSERKRDITNLHKDIWSIN